MSHRGHHASTAGTSTAEAQDWRTQAACWGDDPELWFPIGEPGSKAYERDAAIAKSIADGTGYVRLGPGLLLKTTEVS